ncbi:MAG TPA: MBL fold metallo-hydrolase [Gemmatimonadaceae bacterium]|nr:MBL fold metallo-hydrolase [Gemmatimonadaceae bacterium]
MLLERFHDELLAQTSYLVGCQEAKLAIVVDPNRDIDRYIDAAARHKLTIAFVAETHIHADFVSGARDLARKTGARLILSGSGGNDWQYQFAKEDGARVVRDGDHVSLGPVRLTVRETPGHTPEHICFVVTDRATSDQPVGMLSGDFVFAGDVGRPDLLERAANIEGTMDALARALFNSLREMGSLPDFLQIWPGHGAGSACGKALGAMPSTTLGYERIANWAFQIADEDRFVREVLAGQPEPPKYFAKMKAINRAGPAPAAVAPAELRELKLKAYERAKAAGASVVDVRSTADYASGHLPSTLNLPTGASFAMWAGSLLPYDRDIVLLADDRRRIARARHALTLIGLDRVIGWAGASLREEWRAKHGQLPTVAQIDVGHLAAANERTVIDVRAASEWSEGHMPGAKHLFLGDLVALSSELPRDTPIAVHCQGGTRSVIGTSLLEAQGFTNVANVVGGIRAWEAAGLPLTRDI